MATTGIVDGRLVRLELGATPEKVLHSTSCSISISVETRETASKDIPNGWSDAETGIKSFTLTVEGLFSFDTTVGSPAEQRVNAAELATLISAGDKLNFKMTTGESGDTEYSGQVIFTGLENAFPNNENSTYTANFTGAGELTIAAIA